MDFFTGLEFADFSEACLNLVHENELFFENLNFELVADDYISDLRAYREANDLSTFVLPKVKPDWKDVDEKKKGKFKKIKDTIVEWGKKVIQKIKELIAKAKMLFDDAFKNDNKFLDKVKDCDIMSTSLEGPDPKIFELDLDANNKKFAGYLNGLANAIKDTAGLLDQKVTDTEHAEQRAQAIVAGNYKHLQNAIDELSTEVENCHFYKLNIDNAEEIARNYGIMSIPTLLLFEDGELKKTIIGFHSKDEIRETIVKL